MKNTPFFVLIFLMLSCGTTETAQNADSQKSTAPEKTAQRTLEYVTALGDSVYSSDSPSESMLQKYEEALANYRQDPTDADNIIWLGRRTAYLGRYQEAITIYSKGIALHPTDARMYRHRGHRYISSRAFDQAIIDFENAAALIAGTEDQTEPDGIPNAQNTPVSTLHSNIWYHLGLVYYVKNDLPNAERCYEAGAKVSKNDDMIVSNTHWQYMTFKRLGKEQEANELLSPIKLEMDIIENGSYHRLAQMYKGILAVEDLQSKGGDPSNDAVMYGVGNWYLYNGDSLNARKTYETLLETGNKASFGYIAAEADYVRIFANSEAGK